MATKPTETFAQRMLQFKEQEKKYAAISSRWSWVRVALFVAGIAAGWHFLKDGKVLETVAVLAVGYVLFILILIKHSKADYQARHFGFLQKINEQEIQRAEGELHKFYGCEKCLDPQHPYTSDLDIFGKHSLFALLNRTATDVGQQTLANWLQQPAAAPEIKARQQAVEELTPQLDWRQHLQAKAWHRKQKETQPEQFWQWLRQPDFFAGKLWLKVLTFLLPVLTIAAIFAAIYELIPGYYILFFVLMQYVVGYKFTNAREDYYEKSSGMGGLLKVYQAQLVHVEEQEFKSEKLQQLRQKMFYQNQPLSRQVQKLAQLVEYFSVRMSTLMSFFLNNLLMWDFFWMWRLERWKKQSVPNLEPAIAALAEVETLSSFAAFWYANPNCILPEISEVPFEVTAAALGHPLIIKDDRVVNDFEMSGAGKTVVITGSNMSGKSTFLRTVGLNVVLALAGAPVAARKFRVFPMQVFTSMRTADDLSESTSSFYAELKRLRLLLDLTGTGQTVLFLLDEILKGTNSHDRHLGAVSLVRQLQRQNQSGLISTHDLALGELAEQSPETIRNYSFNSHIESDKIIFDYHLTPGICRSFNASQLMKQMGIEILEG